MVLFFLSEGYRVLFLEQMSGIFIDSTVMLVSMFRNSFLLPQLQDYTFPALQILLLPPDIEDTDLCMKESYQMWGKKKTVEFLYKAARTGTHYICLAHTE